MIENIVMYCNAKFGTLNVLLNKDKFWYYSGERAHQNISYVANTIPENTLMTYANVTKTVMYSYAVHSDSESEVKWNLDRDRDKLKSNLTKIWKTQNIETLVSKFHLSTLSE